MGFSLHFCSEFQDELNETLLWYQTFDENIPERFYKSLLVALEYVKNNPSYFAVKYNNVRCIQVGGFPYLIHYKVDTISKKIIVSSLLDQRRNPKLWKQISKRKL